MRMGNVPFPPTQRRISGANPQTRRIWLGLVVVFAQETQCSTGSRHFPHEFSSSNPSSSATDSDGKSIASLLPSPFLTPPSMGSPSLGRAIAPHCAGKHHFGMEITLAQVSRSHLGITERQIQFPDLRNPIINQKKQPHRLCTPRPWHRMWQLSFPLTSGGFLAGKKIIPKHPDRFGRKTIHSHREKPEEFRTSSLQPIQGYPVLPRTCPSQCHSGHPIPSQAWCTQTALKAKLTCLAFRFTDTKPLSPLNTSQGLGLLSP